MPATTAVTATTAPPQPESKAERPLVLTVRQAASLLGISKDLAYDLIARGELPALRLGRRVVVPTKALLALVER